MYIAIDDETFQQTFVNKTIKDNLKISIYSYLACGTLFFMIENQLFLKRFYLKSLQELKTITGNDRSLDQLDTRVLYQPQGKRDFPTPEDSPI